MIIPRFNYCPSRQYRPNAKRRELADYRAKEVQILHNEGKTTAEILAQRPDWELFRDGCPGGESPQQASERADRVIQRLRAVNDTTLIFSSGHFIRVLAARWVDSATEAPGRHFLLSTASLSAVGYEHSFSRPVIRLWNDDRHVIT